jgi:hypothetical protein
MCFIVCKTTSELECTILTTLYLTSAKQHKTDLDGDDALRSRHLHGSVGSVDDRLELE